MKTTSSSSGSGLGICGCYLYFFVLNLLAGYWSVGYLLYFWGPIFHLSQNVMNMPGIVKFLIGLFLGQFTVPLAILSWLIGLFWYPVGLILGF